MELKFGGTYGERRPRGSFGDTRTRVLLAVIRQDRPSVRSVGDEVGLRSTTTVWRHLVRLREAGLVTWDGVGGGTLRPLVRTVPFG